MKKFLLSLIIFSVLQSSVVAKQVLPDEILALTETITAQKTGEKGKTYFFCADGRKCSTEDVVREYFKNKGYKVMRGEVSVWQAFFALAFFDEIFYQHNFFFQGDLPRGFFAEDTLYQKRKPLYDAKFAQLKQSNIFEFMNRQLSLYGVQETRLLYDAKVEGFEDCVSYFYSDIVQDFLKRIDAEMFAQVVFRIAQNPNQNRAGVPDYVVWNDKELIFVEVKREKETLREKQIDWAKYLIKSKIPYRLVRVKGLAL